MNFADLLRKSLFKAGVSRWAPWADAVAGLAYPNWCQVCAAKPATSREGYVCSACRAVVKPVEPPFCRRCGLPFPGAITGPFSCANCRDLGLHFDHARAASVAAGPLRDILHRYKYQGARWFEPFLGRLLVDAASQDDAVAGSDALAPVPLHPTRLRERGFNQAERLARRLAAAAGKPVWTDVVARTESTGTQTALGRRQRAANMAGAFVPSGRRIDGARVVVIDDIFTTGATTNAVAAALRRAGAAHISVWTVGRAPLAPAPPKPQGPPPDGARYW